MIYTEEVRKKIENILKAFESYIDNQNHFDIVCSTKVGYLWVVVDDLGSETPERLDTPENLLDNLFNDIINDVVAPRESTSLMEECNLTEQEATEVRHIASTILNTIPEDADGYLDYLNSYIQDYQKRCRESME